MLGPAGGQGQEFARILRNGEDATLSVFGPRPVDLAAKKLVDEFGIAVSVEDPVYLYRDDVQDVTPPRMASTGGRTLIPKAALLEMRFGLRSDGSPQNVPQLVQGLVDSAVFRGVAPSFRLKLGTSLPGTHSSGCSEANRVATASSETNVEATISSEANQDVSTGIG